MKFDLCPNAAEGYWSWLGSPILTNFIYFFTLGVAFITLIVVSVSAFIAWQAWRTTARHNANEHVHKLFSDYLKARLEAGKTNLGVISEPDAEQKSEIHHYIDGEITGMKLYTLEEMYNWIMVQRNLQKYTKTFQRAKTVEVINDNIEAWTRTIVVHALQDFKKTKESMELYACCYSAEFIAFIASESGDKDLEQLSMIHQHAIFNKHRRPLGDEEKRLKREVSGD